MSELKTARLRLEVLKPEHADGMWAGLQAPEIYAHIAESPPVDVAALRGRYGRLAVGRSADGSRLWFNWVLWCEGEARYIGYVQATVAVGGDATIAYVLFPDAWGKGYAREAVSAMVAHLIECYRPPSIRATVDTRNVRSVALLVALGFKLAEVRIGAEWIGGVLTDEGEYVVDCKNPRENLA